MNTKVLEEELNKVDIWGRLLRRSLTGSITI